MRKPEKNAETPLPKQNGENKIRNANKRELCIPAEKGVASFKISFSEGKHWGYRWNVDKMGVK